MTITAMHTGIAHLGLCEKSIIVPSKRFGTLTHTTQLDLHCEPQVSRVARPALDCRWKCAIEFPRYDGLGRTAEKTSFVWLNYSTRTFQSIIYLYARSEDSKEAAPKGPKLNLGLRLLHHFSLPGCWLPHDAVVCPVWAKSHHGLSLLGSQS